MANFFLTSLAIVLILPVLFLLLQTLAAVFFAKSSTTTDKAERRPQLTVLMPAHNESLVITQTLQSILPQLSDEDQLLVVADNCNDDTALIARKLGANVIERKNKLQRGKG